MFRAVPTDQAQAMLTSVMGAFEAGDRLSESRRFPGFAAMDPARRSEVGRLRTARSHPRLYYGFTDHEFSVYGVLRTKHGMTQEQAAAAVLRSRASAPNPQAR